MSFLSIPKSDQIKLIGLNLSFWEGNELLIKWGHDCLSGSAPLTGPGHLCLTDLASSRAALLASAKDLASRKEHEAFQVVHIFFAAVHR